jgi:hypothetical protein
MMWLNLCRNLPEDADSKNNPDDEDTEVDRLRLFLHKDRTVLVVVGSRSSITEGPNELA